MVRLEEGASPAEPQLRCDASSLRCAVEAAHENARAARQAGFGAGFQTIADDVQSEEQPEINPNRRREGTRERVFPSAQPTVKDGAASGIERPPGRLAGVRAKPLDALTLLPKRSCRLSGRRVPCGLLDRAGRKAEARSANPRNVTALRRAFAARGTPATTRPKTICRATKIAEAPATNARIAHFHFTELQPEKLC